MNRDPSRTQMLAFLPQDNAAVCDPASEHAIAAINCQVGRLLRLSPLEFWEEVRSGPTEIASSLDSFLRFKRCGVPCRHASEIIAPHASARSGGSMTMTARTRARRPASSCTNASSCCSRGCECALIDQGMELQGQGGFSGQQGSEGHASICCVGSPRSQEPPRLPSAPRCCTAAASWTCRG